MQRPTPPRLKSSCMGTVSDFKQSVLSCGEGAKKLREADTESDERNTKYASYGIDNSSPYIWTEIVSLEAILTCISRADCLWIMIQHAWH